MLRRRETLRLAADSAAQEQRGGLRPPIGPLARIGYRAALVLLVVFTSWKWITKATDYVRAPVGTSDFTIYYDVALTLRDNPHANIYDATLVRAVASAHHVYLGTGQFQYPPLLPILVMPLTWLPYNTAAHVWLYFNLALWLVGTVLLIDLLRRALRGHEARLFRPSATLPPSVDGRNAFAWMVGSGESHWDETLFAVTLAVVLSFKYGPLAESMWLGQASPLIFVLVLLAPWLLRRGKPGLAGGVLALAAWIKVFPALLIVYFLLRRQWRVVAGAVVGALLLALAMVPLIGLSGILSTRQIVTNGSYESMGYQNEALARVPMWIALWLGQSMSAGLTLAGFALIAVVALVFMGGVLDEQRRRVARGRALGSETQAESTVTLLGYHWALCTMVLVSPIMWEHHDAWILPAIVFSLGVSLRALTVGVRDTEGRLKPEVWFVVTVVLAYLLTRGDFPYYYDTVSTPALSVQFLGHPLRPMYMVMRPAGGLLVWLVAGALFMRHASMQADATAVASRQTQRELAMSAVSRALPSANT